MPCNSRCFIGREIAQGCSTEPAQGYPSIKKQQCLHLPSNPRILPVLLRVAFNEASSLASITPNDGDISFTFACHASDLLSFLKHLDKRPNIIDAAVEAP